MAEIYYPFESVNTGTTTDPVYDRAITAEDERAFNRLRYTNGVFSSVGDGLAVTAGNGMVVSVGSGGAHIEGALYYNSAPITLSIEESDASLARIDRIVLQFNTSVSVRSVRLLVRTGTAATNPVAPDLRQESNLYEIALADITVGKGVTTIAQSAITDQRLNSSLCGVVVAAIPTNVDTTGLYDQYQASLDEWLDTVAAALDETLAGELQTQIEALESRLDTDVQSVALGGTGATTAAAARTNLGVKACGTYATLPIANGGTGATTKVDAKDNLGVKYAGVAASARGSNSSLSLSAGTITKVTLNTWISRTDTSFSFSSGGIKCPYTGTVMINASAYVVSNSTSSIARGGIYLYDSAGSEITGNYSGYSGQGINISTLIDVSAGDIIYLKVRNSLAGTCATDNGATYLGIQYIK